MSKVKKDAVTLIGEMRELIDQLESLLPGEPEEATSKPSAKTSKGKATPAPKEEEAPETESHIITVVDDDENEVQIDLDEMSLKELKEFVKENGLEVSAKDREGIIEEIISLVNEDDSEGDGEEDGEEPEDPAEKYGLNGMEDSELKDLLSEAGLSIKGKREALIDRILGAIEDGTIVAEDTGDEDGEEGDGEEDGEELQLTEETLAAQAALEKKIRAQFKKGDLKPNKIKSFLKDYYEGNPDCGECPKGCSQEDQLDCYIAIQVSFIDDEGATHAQEEPYTRGGENFCCGKMLEPMEDGNFHCEICGTDYEG